MEPRVAKVESHVEYIRRDIDSVVTGVKAFRSEMRDEFKTMRTDMQDEFKAFRTAMQTEFKTLRTEMHDELKTFRTDMHDELNAVRTDFSEHSRIMLVSLVAFAVGMTGLLAKGFGWL